MSFEKIVFNFEKQFFIVFGSARRGYFRNYFEMIRCVFISKVVKRAKSSALFTKLKKL